MRHLVTLLLLTLTTFAVESFEMPSPERIEEVRQFSKLIDQYPLAPVEVRTLRVVTKDKFNRDKVDIYCHIGLPTLRKELALTPSEAKLLSGALDADFYNASLYAKLWVRGQKQAKKP